MSKKKAKKDPTNEVAMPMLLVVVPANREEKPLATFSQVEAAVYANECKSDCLVLQTAIVAHLKS